MPENMDKLVWQHYPNAQRASDSITHHLDRLHSEHGFNFRKTLFATSVCADDINVSADLSKIMAKPFTMGGLGGLPCTGLTGMVAYSHHIPDNGFGLIFYGPHIGLTEEGEIGRVRRPGQKRLTNSCGALMLALERLSSVDREDVYVPMSTELDYQQILLERTVMPFKQEILTAESPQKAITEVLYNNIHKLVHRFVGLAKHEFLCKKIAMIGATIINSGPEYDDYVDIKNFEVIDVQDIQSIELCPIETAKAYREL